MASRLLLPLEAVARTAGVLVARPRAAVVHLALPLRPLTPTGRLAKGDRPVCTTARKPHSRARFDGRPLCARCSRTVTRTAPVDLLPAELTEARLRATILSARTVEEISAAVRLLCAAERGLTLRLQTLVRDQRTSLGLNQRDPRPLPEQRARRGEGRRQAWWQTAGSDQ